MAYPLIILGAGASYDYSTLGKVAPLTNQLIDNNFLYPDLLKKYKGSGNLLSDIVHQVQVRKRNFEEVLTEMQQKTKHSQTMRSHFVALEFYLKELFARISSPADLTLRTHQINNYKVLINRLDTYSEGKALVATFNYDTLFESNLSSGIPKRMRDYVSADIKIFKLHGSHDWIYINRTSEQEKKFYNIENGFDFCLQNPDYLEQIKSKEDPRPPIHEKELEESRESSDFLCFPAIAIPLVGKDKYITPKNHIQLFEKHLPQVDRILVIGWRAGDPLLLETLKNHLPKMGYKVLVVSGTKEDAEETAKIIKGALGIIHGGIISAIGGGFSSFVSSEMANTFFAD